MSPLLRQAAGLLAAVLITTVTFVALATVPAAGTASIIAVPVLA